MLQLVFAVLQVQLSALFRVLPRELVDLLPLPSALCPSQDRHSRLSHTGFSNQSHAGTAHQPQRSAETNQLTW